MAVPLGRDFVPTGPAHGFPSEEAGRMARWLDAYTLGPRACSLRDGACTLPHRETGLVARCKLSGLSGGLLTVIPASYWPLPHPSNVGADPLLLL